MSNGLKRIEPIKRLEGQISLPGDKSISHRAVMLGAIANGETRIKGLLNCDDCNYTIRAFKDMGVAFSSRGDYDVIYGNGLYGLDEPKFPINVGESGTTMRLLAGILAGQRFKSVLEGEESLSKRPMKRIIEPLSLMGVNINGTAEGYPPLTIRGGNVKPISYKIPVSSAQVKSAILLAGLYANGLTKVEEVFKSRDHTERMLKYFGAAVNVKGLKVSIKGGRELVSRTLEIPGDISSASFFMVGAVLLPGSHLRIERVGINPTRAGILNILSHMGARVKIFNRSDLFESVGDIEVEHAATKGITIEKELIPGIIDELPALFVLASLSRGMTVIKGAGELKVKETDRITSMRDNLLKMGAKIEVRGEDIIIEGVAELKGSGALKSFGDHRTCMAMAIASIAAKGSSEIDDVSCVSKSFPGFFNTLDSLT